jgi:two-component system cell cycle sensor histidine kinase/response regulator CckA
MPGKRGCEVLDDTRKIRPDAKVLFMSGYSEDVAARDYLTEDGACFISKPPGVPDLRRKFRDALDR